jgi:hypothetical protein
MSSPTPPVSRRPWLRYYWPALVFATVPVVNAAGLYTRFTPVQAFELVRAMLAAAVLAALAAGALRFAPGDDRVKAAGLAVAVLFVSVYPRVASRLHVRPYGWPDAALLAAYLAALVTALALLGWFAPASLSGIQGVLAALALLFGAYAVWFGVTTTRHDAPLAGLDHPGGQPVRLPPESRAPDIIHVIFDGLGRLDYLERDYGVAAAPERTKLESRGMLVADEAVANYSQTYLSVGAMLSMGYLDRVAARLRGSRDRTAVEDVIRQSAVVRALVERGYDFTLLSSGYEVLEHHPEARDGIGGPTAFGEFESYVFRRSPFRTLPVGPLSYLPHRGRTRALIAALYSFEPAARPRYVLAHILVPHPPFVFGPGGESRTPPGVFTIADGNGFAQSDAVYRKGYADQVRFAFTAIQGLLERLRRLPRPPVVIVNGDHGPGLDFDQIDPLKGPTASRMALFLGISGAGTEPARLPRSPVNIYRYVFNRVFETDLPLLPDRSYVSAFTQPYVFHQVQVPPAGPAPGSAGRGSLAPERLQEVH